jgi:hypothetical protein
MIFTKDDIITTDKYYNNFKNIYFKTDAIVNNNIFNWRGINVYPPTKHMDVIISGHSDFGIHDSQVELFSPQIWYTVNKQTSNSSVCSIPLGITNNTNESNIHPVYGDLDSMIEVMAQSIEKKNLVYMNFNIGTYAQERQLVWNLFNTKKWVTIGNTVNTIAGRTNFLKEIKAHHFVLCPRGNGVDTHRLWETLYMGSIPIVKRNVAYEEFYDLPICFIDDWAEINEDFLENEKNRINNNIYCLDKLKISYWVDRINTSIEKII